MPVCFTAFIEECFMNNLTKMKLSTLFLGMLISQASFANCGPFGLIGDNDYCVRCPGKQDSRQNSCPGGEVGLVAMGVANPGCQITYFDGHCNGFTPQALLPKIKKRQNASFNPVKPGRAAVTQNGDIVIIRMMKDDFEKLMKADSTKPISKQ
jgi:hypothetical protein